MKERLLHLSPAENEASIMATGIRGPRIYLFTDMIVANTIAREQVFTDRYVVFEVDPAGIMGKLERDEVAEFTGGYHRVVRQRRIAPEYLKVVGTFSVVPFGIATEWDYLVYGRLDGITRPEIDKMLAGYAKQLQELRAGAEQ